MSPMRAIWKPNYLNWNLQDFSLFGSRPNPPERERLRPSQKTWSDQILLEDEAEKKVDEVYINIYTKKKHQKARTSIG